MTAWMCHPAALAVDARGATGIEFAIGGLMIMTIMFIIFDIGLIFLAQCGLDYGTAVAARWGAANSSTVSAATVLTHFKTAASSLLGTSTQSCLSYSSAASVPAGTVCYLVVTFSSGATVGSQLTVQAYYKWSPVAPVDGFKATTLKSTVIVTIQN